MTSRTVILSAKAAAFLNTPAPRMDLIEDIYTIQGRTEWFVVYTDANREAKVIESLDQMGVSSFYPRTVEWKPRTRAERDRKKPLEAVERPLLSRYLFAELPAAQRAFGRILQIDGVKDILGNGEAKIPVPRPFVELLRDREQAGEFNKTVKRGRVVAPKWAVKDAEVRVTAGPFAGFLGVIERCLPKDVVQIAISMFGRTSSTRLSLAQVEES